MLPPAEMRGLNVLVVEGNPVARRAIKETLGQFYFSVTTVGSAFAALVEFDKSIKHNSPFSLLLIDWFLPGMDGVQLTEQITKRVGHTAKERGTKIILMTGYGQEGVVKDQARQAGVDTIMSKPINCSLLFDTIMELFGKEVEKVYQSGLNLLPPGEIMESIEAAKVLLIEDNLINQQVACEILRSIGIEVEVAENGLEGVENTLEGGYDLVLMDLSMPEMDGYTATQIIRSHAMCRDLPIVAMTASAMVGDREKCLAAGMNDYIAKPVNRKQLYETIVRWISPRKTWPRESGPRESGPRESGPITVGDSQNNRSWLDLVDTLPGIDVMTAQEHLNQNYALFRSILMEFLGNYASATEDIQYFLQGKRKEDHTSAQRLAHSVKGIAGNLAAGDLYNAASKLEAGIKNNQCEQWPILLKRFQQTMTKILSSIRTFQEEEVIYSGVTENSLQVAVDLKEIKLQMRQFSDYLLSKNSDALEVFLKLKIYLKQYPYVNEMVGCLDEQLDQLDFKQAHLTLINLAKKLDIMVEE